MLPFRQKSGRAIRGAALLEYAILVSALSMATIGATWLYGEEVRRYFLFEAQAVEDLPPDPEWHRPDFPEHEAGDPHTPTLPEPVSPPDPGEGEIEQGGDPEFPETGHDEDLVDGDTENPSDGKEDTGSDNTETAGCGPWRDFDMGVFTSNYAVQIITAANRIGFYAANGTLEARSEETIDLKSVVALGQEQETYVLVVEHDQDVEYFTDHSRISVFAEDGDKLVNRALVMLDGPGDLRQGDEYVIAHTMDLMIDINGVNPGKTIYTKAGQGGLWMVGNNDTSLAFRDIGCVIQQPPI